MWIQLANVKPGKKERFLELRRRLLAKAANSPVITAWYTFDMDVGRGVGPLADQGCMHVLKSGVGGLILNFRLFVPLLLYTFWTLVKISHSSFGWEAFTNYVSTQGEEGFD